MKAIAAMAENRAIGLNGGIPWHVKADFQWFKEFTLGKTIIVGKNTFDTLPLLKRRDCWVLARKVVDCDNQNIVNKNGQSGLIVDYNYIQKNIDTCDSQCIVAGGAKTYKLLMPFISEFYVTIIHGEYTGDVFMPDFEHFFSNQEVIKKFDEHRVIKYSK